MEELLPALQKYEVWIYSVLGVIALFYFQKLISAWKEWQGTVFGLERTVAQRRFSTALTVLVLLMLFVFVEFVIVSFVVPAYPQSLAMSTPTIDLLATQTVTLPSAVDSLSVQATPDVTPSPTVVVMEEGCEPGRIEWIFPEPGQEIRSTVELKGTVNVPNLGFYKYEFSRPGEDVWNTIAAGNQPKVEGGIGFWNTSSLVPGDYLLRLVVSDNANELFPACIVPVRVIQP
jgi:hypothetical protein